MCQCASKLYTFFPQCASTRLKQHTLAHPTIIPLTATVGNAIYDYIKYERQNKMGMSNLFLNTFDIKKHISVPLKLGRS